MEALRNLVIKLMEEKLNEIKAGTCEMTEDEAMDLVSVFSHQVMSKYDVCRYLNISGKKFDYLVKKGKLPKGKKKGGFNELRYYKDEVNSYIK